MQKVIFLSMAAIVAVFVMSCAPKNSNLADRMDATTQMSDSVAVEGISSSAAVATESDTARKFIRTADLKFKVKEVIKATYIIEDIVRDNGGFVTETNLTSSAENEDRKRISDDSVLLVTRYTIRNYITIRVPNTLLDTTLKQIAPIIEYLDYRNIKATDVGLDVLSNRLAVMRSRRHNQRVEPTLNGNQKSDERVKASESLMNSEEKADQAAIANLTLADKINFSTINLEIYQNASTKYSLVGDARNYDSFRPGFGQQMAEAFRDGFQLFKTFLLLLIRLWWLLLIALVIIFYLQNDKRRKKRIRNSNQS